MASTTFYSPDLRAYFQSKRAGLDAQLVARVVAFIEATETSLDCAIYDLRHPEILAALAKLAQRHGIRLRIAFDGGGERNGGASGDPKPSGTTQAVREAGLNSHATAIHEHGRHLMHDKFMVRDGRAIWVGSANMTAGGLELQDNNCLEIMSPELAKIYTATFEELISPAHQHEEHGPGRRSTADHPSPAPVAVTVGGARITPYFAPAAGENIEQALIEAMRKAQRIRILAFLIGDPGILDALAPFASNHSFDIRGVYDPHGMQDVTRSMQHGGHEDHAGRTGKSPHAALSDGSLWFLHDPRFIAAPSHGFAAGREQDFMHNKVIVVDDRLVFTGSYNFSENAEANDETLLAIESPALAAAYTAYFDTLAETYAHAATREPVAVAAGAGAGGVALSAAATASDAAPSADDMVAQLRQEYARGAEKAQSDTKSRGGRRAVRHAPHTPPATAATAAQRPARPAHPAHPARAKRSRSQLDRVIALVVALIVLTALALVTYSVLALNGVLVAPFAH